MRVQACISICIYICMYLCMSACAHAHMYLRAYVCTYVCTFIHIYITLCVWVHDYFKAPILSQSPILRALQQRGSVLGKLMYRAPETVGEMPGYVWDSFRVSPL